MARRTLIDFFDDLAGVDAEFLAHDDGYRTWAWSYRDLASAAQRFASRLTDHGVGAGSAIVIWSENRPEWVAALWGALLDAVVLVPIDYRASAEFLQKVSRIVDAKAILVGDVVDAESLGSEPEIWKLGEIFRDGDRPSAIGHPPSEITADATAEIIFTSGATAEPKGVVLTHRNILANIVPIEREMAKYQRYIRPFSPIRFL